MRPGKFFRKRSIVFSFLISYICILIIPILIGGIIYFKSLDIVKNEITQSNTAMLRQVQQTIDSRLIDVNNLLLMISLDNRVLSTMNVRNKLDAMNRYTMKQIIDDLHSYTVANSFINNLYIFFKNTDLVITSNASFDSKYAFERFNYSSMTYDYWYTLMTEKSSKHVFKFLKNDRYRKSIAFVKTIPMQYKADPLASVVIELDDKAFNSAIKNIERVSQGAVLIIDNEDQILFSTEKIELPEYAKYKELSNAKETMHGKIGDQDVVISHIRSNVCDWEYISIIPVNIYMQKANFINGLAILCLSICLTLGIMLTIFFSKKNYDPIDGLVKALSKEASLSTNRDMNEVKFIQDFIDKTLDEKKKLQNRLEQQRQMLKDNFLKRLIKGQVNINIPIIDACESYDIYFYSNDFAIMIFNIEDIEESFFDDDTGTKDQDLAIVNFIIKNVIEELIGQKNVGYLVEMDKFLVCLVNFKHGVSQNSGKGELIDVAAYAMSFIKEKFGIVFSVAVSDIYKTVMGISKAYQQAIEVVEYRNLMGGELITHYDDIKELRDDTVGIDNFNNAQEQFSNCIKVTDYNLAQSTLNDIIQDYFVQSSVCAYLAKCRMFALTSTFINAVGEAGNIYNENLLCKFDVLEKLSSCQNIKDLQYMMDGILDDIDKYALEKQEGLYVDQIETIKQIIKDRYFAPDLSVSSLAQEMGMSTSYLSKFFRESTGTGLLDYIHKTRLDNAKELLKNQDLTIKTIARNVGYINSDSFIRVFKRYEGVTPGKYREIL